MSSTTHHDELENAPILRSLRREDPFATPTQFFDQLPGRVQQRIRTETTPSPLRSLWVRFRIPAGAALAVTILAFLAWWPTNVQPSHPTMEVAEMGAMNSDPDSYEPDEHDLMAAYSDDPDLYTAVGNGFGTDELTAYLLNEDLSLDQLIEEL